MSFSLEKNLKRLLGKYKIFPSRKLGQNFLTDKSAIKKMAGAADLNSNDIVLEIGPGTGSLTKELAKKVKRVVAIEKDPKMVEILKENLKSLNNVGVIRADVLKLQTTNYKLQTNSKFKIVGNLPFYLTAPVIRKFLESNNQPKEMVLVVQKEVGQRICASPAKVFASQKIRRASPRKMSILAVSVQFYAEAEIISYISKKSFWPEPEVDAAIIRIIPAGRRKINKDLFFKIVKAGFSQPRKQLVNNLSKGLKVKREKIRKWLLKKGFQPARRAETLDVDDWIKLTESIADI